MRRLAGRDAEEKNTDASEEEQANTTAGGVIATTTIRGCSVATPPYNRQQLSCRPAMNL
jgi:hypothetical protein